MIGSRTQSHHVTQQTSLTMKRFLFSLLALPTLVFAQSGLPAQPFIYVEGKAEVSVPAEVVTLSFELSALARDQVEANKVVQAQAKEVLALLDRHKIPQKDVIASDLRSTPEYETGEAVGEGRGKLVGYRVTRPFKVKVTELKIFSGLVDELFALRVEQFTSIEEEVADPQALEGQAWDKAIAKARALADKTLKPAGMKADSIWAISPVAFPDISQKVFGDRENSMLPGNAAYMVADRAKVEPSQYRLARVTVTQRVHIIYLISPSK